MLYFSITSLSTIGFGDFHPRSDDERILGAFILMFGVSIFSYILGNFLEIIEAYKDFNKDPDEDEALEKFFCMLRVFNHGEVIDSKIQKRFGEFFNYRWSNHKNFLIQNSEDLRIFNELPVNVQINIYAGFIYYDFLSSFEGTFFIEK